MDKPSTSRSINTQDPNYSDKILSLLDPEVLNQSADDDDSVVDDSNADPDYILSNDEDEDYSSDDWTDDENDLLEGGEDSENINIRNMVADNVPLPQFFLERMRKNKVGPPNAWKSAPLPTNVRTSARNMLQMGLPGLTGRARALGNKPRREDIWKLFFDDNIISRIVSNTNIKLAATRQNLGPGTNRSNYMDTNSDEINALIGLLLKLSILKSKDEKMQSLFTKDEFNRPIFRATMSGKRYEILVGCLRFDDRQARDKKKLMIKLRPSRISFLSLCLTVRQCTALQGLSQ